MRLQCPIEGFEQCYVEISDRWTRREIREFRTARTEDAVGILTAKIIAVYLECADGNHITEPAQMTEERLDEVDARVYLWLPGALLGGLRELESLGFLAGLQRSATTAATSTPTTNSPNAS